MTGPNTPPPPGGPGRGYAAPLTEEQRMLRYFAQNGMWRLTPRQRRRVDHKSLRAAIRAGLGR
jgi:hypothetical protein